MASYIDKWHTKNIKDHGFENDDDFEELKVSPVKVEKTMVLDDDDFDFLRKGTYKLFSAPRNYNFNINYKGDPASPRKRASRKQAANARG